MPSRAETRLVVRDTTTPSCAGCNAWTTLDSSFRGCGPFSAGNILKTSSVGRSKPAAVAYVDVRWTGGFIEVPLGRRGICSLMDDPWTMTAGRGRIGPANSEDVVASWVADGVSQ